MLAAAPLLAVLWAVAVSGCVMCCRVRCGCLSPCPLGWWGGGLFPSGAARGQTMTGSDGPCVSGNRTPRTARCRCDDASQHSYADSLTDGTHLPIVVACGSQPIGWVVPRQGAPWSSLNTAR